MQSDYIKALNENGKIAFSPKGNSMWPTLKSKKNTVIIEKKSQRLNRFDVGFYVRADGTYILHRVIDVCDGGYIFCGDSQSKKEKVAEQNVYGVMTGFYRGKKFISVTAPKYKKQVEKLYKNDKKRVKKARFFMRLKRLASLFSAAKGDSDD